LLARFGAEPRLATEAFAELRSAWGQLSERRLWRALRALVDGGLLARVGRKHAHARYVRAQQAGHAG